MKLLSLSTSLTGSFIFIAFLCSCNTAKQINTPFVGYIEGIRVVKSDDLKVQENFIGPDAMMEALPVETKQVEETNIEKGGKMTYMAPAWAMKQPEMGIELYADDEVLAQAARLKEYAIENSYDTGYAFLINMSLKSGKKRFYVVNLETMTIANSGLVAHGRGEERFTFNKDFSNNPGSNCTSLGRYKIGKSYEGQFGLAYKLHGLDNTTIIMHLSGL
jgi:hypothetical protein